MLEVDYYEDNEINETSVDMDDPIFIPSSRPVGIGIESTFVLEVPVTDDTARFALTESDVLAFDTITHFSIYYSSYYEITTPRKFRKYGLKDMKIPENRIHTIHLIEREVDNCISLKTGEHFYKMY